MHVCIPRYLGYSVSSVIVESDAYGLEVVTAGYLSRDETLMGEIRDQVDIHQANKERFNLPERRIAKIFKFRLIYGGTAFAYAKDPDFNWISTDPDYWQGIVDEYYNKYKGLHEWHETIVQTVENTSRLVMPTGRVYEYQPYLSKWGKWVWPRTTILNYPVQGLGHDLMAIARVSAYKRLSKYKSVLFVNSVHDSIVVDCSKNMVYTVCATMEDVFHDIPTNFRRQFGVEFDLPMRCESKYGPNWGDMKEFDKKEEIWKSK